MAENLYFDKYAAEKLLGEGSYGKVKLARDVTSNEKVALKILQKKAMKKQVHITRIKREVRIMRLLSHPHVARLIDVSETEKEIILAMEFIQGGELFNYIVSQSKVKERFARRFFRQCLSAVDYCHQNCVIHRDLKPENLLLDQYQNIKIIDFGFVNMFDPNDKLNTFCGSPFYASPAQEYVGPEVDIWSLGVILFTMLSGHLPFQEENTAELCRRIASANFTMPDYFSDGSADLIKKMLTADPKKRIRVEEIRNHPWTCEGYSGPPNAHIPERPALDMDSILDEEVLEKMSKYGFSAYSQKEKIIQPNGPAFSVYYLIKEHLERKKMDYDSSKIAAAVPVSPTPATSVSPNEIMPAAAMKHTRRPSMGIPSFSIGQNDSHTPADLDTNISATPDNLVQSSIRNSPVDLMAKDDGDFQSLAALPKSRKFSMFQGWIKQKDDYPISPPTAIRNSNRRTSTQANDRLSGNSELSLNLILGKFRRTSVASRAGPNPQDSGEISNALDVSNSSRRILAQDDSVSVIESNADVNGYEGPRSSFQSRSANSEGLHGTRPSLQSGDSYGRLSDYDGHGPRPSFQSLASHHNSVDFSGNCVGPRPSCQSSSSVDYGGHGRPSVSSKYAGNNSGSRNVSCEDFGSDNAWTPDSDNKKGGHHHVYKKSPLEAASAKAVEASEASSDRGRKPSSPISSQSQSNANSSSKNETTSGSSKLNVKITILAKNAATPISNTTSNNGNTSSQQTGSHLTDQTSPLQSTPNSEFVPGPGEDTLVTKHHKPKFFETLSSALKRFVTSDSKKRENLGQIREIPETSLLNENAPLNKPIADIMNEINRVVFANKIAITWTSAFKALCNNELTEFEIEICRIRDIGTHGIEFKRIKGSAWIYQSLCREISGLLFAEK